MQGRIARSICVLLFIASICCDLIPARADDDELLPLPTFGKAGAFPLGRMSVEMTVTDGVRAYHIRVYDGLGRSIADFRFYLNERTCEVLDHSIGVDPAAKGRGISNSLYRLMGYEARGHLGPSHRIRATWEMDNLRAFQRAWARSDASDPNHLINAGNRTPDAIALRKAGYELTDVQVRSRGIKAVYQYNPNLLTPIPVPPRAGSDLTSLSPSFFNPNDSGLDLAKMRPPRFSLARYAYNNPRGALVAAGGAAAGTGLGLLGVDATAVTGAYWGYSAYVSPYVAGCTSTLAAPVIIIGGIGYNERRLEHNYRENLEAWADAENVLGKITAIKPRTPTLWSRIQMWMPWTWVHH